MSIFGIIGLSIMITAFIVAFHFLICAVMDNYDSALNKKTLVIYVVLTLVAVFVGIAINTESETIFIDKYIAQKTTIEQSLESTSISDMERIELVNKAVDLNGELASHKSRYERWHHVTYDRTMYNDVEFIVFN